MQSYKIPKNDASAPDVTKEWFTAVQLLARHKLDAARFYGIVSQGPVDLINGISNDNSNAYV